MKDILIILCLYTLGMAKAIGLPKDPAEYAEWERKAFESVNGAMAASPEEAIPRLGEWVFKLSLSHHREKDDRPVFQAAQKALLAIPGHADYYARQIEEGKKEVLAGSDRPGKGAVVSDLQRIQMFAFATLEQMPSPETIRVLGEFLYDPWGLNPDAKPGESPGGEDGRHPNAMGARTTLDRMPIANRPIQGKNRGWEAYWTDIDAWKLWYEQIKAGTRTIRFEGDPQEYNLYGPVDRAKEPETVRLPKPLPADLADVEEASSSSFHWPALLAALAACGAGAWLVLRRTSPASDG